MRNSRLGSGIDPVEPYANMSADFPWQSMCFAEYANSGPGAAVTDPAGRPRLTRQEAGSATPQAYLAGADRWTPWKER